MKNNRLEFVVKIVFFGALWGLVEATLGYALHILPALIAGSIMFPIVMVILYQAYKSLDSRKAILFVGFVAILIKSSNLLLPFLFPAKTINPMIAMFIQSLLAFAFIPNLSSSSIVKKIAILTGISLTWRLGMIGYYAINYSLTSFLDFRIANFDSALAFVVFEGLISGAFAIILVIGYEKFKLLDRVKTLRINPILSTVALALALFFTLYKF
ncbi:MAG: hypothetical protein WCY80_00050 [Candidatus Izemoplasmatales bacterium]